jgi:ATP-dependent helicase HrpA
VYRLRAATSLRCSIVHSPTNSSPAPCDYRSSTRSSPGDDADGVTAVVPLPSLSQLSSPRAEWLVPGMVAEKVEALDPQPAETAAHALRAAGETAKKVVAKLPPFGSGSLLEAVAGLLWNFSGQRITRDDFQPSRSRRTC